ncbi:tetratricopeptide repeat protein [cf. Phormidesmis sp. LEGE 11477]|uniref:tetratricopeptide repeat protein n=1 Tax=cf. Phormidesmis sp. LEGE 11477 TaxID=1828680 RepID=UPI001881D4BB|nr:tetratricopeptide repeat protein [cf. Phormidesmis sp. LEGE 11477]MBE9061766.1 tetratricopeptide repeat protein [cf. Phormidesmis sp. LEGE 11477]
MTTPDSEQERLADAKFKLSWVWLAKGKPERAIAGLREVLQICPTHKQAPFYLEYLLQQQQDKAQRKHNPEGKISLVHQKWFATHRSGWRFALQALEPLHSDQGVLFDGCLENSFLWNGYQYGQTKAPYKQPWVGFLHNPPNMPAWFYGKDSPQVLLEKEHWQESLEYCVGLFCLSEYFADWLRSRLQKPISALIHPTEIPAVQFDFDQFVANGHKKVVQLGWWLRKLNAIYQLPIAKGNALGYEKIKLNPAFAFDAERQLVMLGEREKKAEGLVFDPSLVANTREIAHVSNQDYDRLLSENIGFISLYDTSANNALIECIARATPLLINPLPAVVEYLGKDYPMYFQSLSEAAKKAEDLALIKATHEYLKSCDTRSKLSPDYFCQSFEASEVYQCIP